MIVPDIEVGEDLDEAGANLAKSCFLSVRGIVRNHLDNGRFNFRFRGEAGLCGLLLGSRIAGKKILVGAACVGGSGLLCSHRPFLRGGSGCRAGLAGGVSGGGVSGAVFLFGTVLALGAGRSFFLLTVTVSADDIKENKTLAGDTEGLGSFLFSHADDNLSGFPKPGGKLVEVAIA